jgi:hypothetical protein
VRVVILLCAVAYADTSLPVVEDPHARCEAEINHAANKLNALGHGMFRAPLYTRSYDWVHVTFTDGHGAIAYVAITAPLPMDASRPAWRDHRHGEWWRSVKHLGPWAAEMGLTRGSPDEERRFAAFFKPVAEVCLADANNPPR